MLKEYDRKLLINASGKDNLPPSPHYDITTAVNNTLDITSKKKITNRLISRENKLSVNTCQKKGETAKALQTF